MRNFFEKTNSPPSWLGCLVILIYQHVYNGSWMCQCNDGFWWCKKIEDVYRHSNQFRCSIKQVASGIKDKWVGRALLSTSVAVAPQLMNSGLYKLVYNVRALRIPHNTIYNGYIVYEGVP